MFTVLARWAQEQGCCVNGYPAMHANGLRGFAASTYLDAGDVLVTIPETLLISQESALTSELVSSHSLQEMHSSLYTWLKFAVPSSSWNLQMNFVLAHSHGSIRRDLVMHHVLSCIKLHLSSSPCRSC